MSTIIREDLNKISSKMELHEKKNLLNENALPPPPLPPPPTESTRYMVTIPFYDNLGFELEPLLPSHNPTGAKISKFDPNRDRNLKHNMQVGDIIYKIDGVVTKTRSFKSIIDNIRYRLHSNDDHNNAIQGNGVRFIFERQPQQRHHQTELSASKSNIKTEQNNPRSAKKIVRRPPHLCSPNVLDLSQEGNVLTSIFHRRSKNRQQQDQQQANSYDDIENDDVNFGRNQRKEPSPCSSKHLSPEPDLEVIPECKAVVEDQQTSNDDQYSPSNASTRDLDDRCELSYTTFDYSSSASNRNYHLSPIGISSIRTTKASELPQSERPQSERPRSVSWINDSDLSKSYLSSDVEYLSSEHSKKHRVVEQSQQLKSYDAAVYSQYDTAESSQGQISTSNHNDECFHTPHSEHGHLMDALSISSVYLTPPEVCNSSTSRSQETQTYKKSSVPMWILDYESIRNCNSVQKLENVVKTLSATSPPEFPALLRMAKEQINIIQESSQGSLTDYQHYEEPKVGQDESSKDHMHGEFTLTTDEETIHKQDDSATDNTDMESTMIDHAEKTDILEKVINERNDMQFHLSSQVEILKETLQALENDMDVNKKDANNRIKLLEEAKRAADIKLEREQMALAASSKEAREVLAELKLRTLEVDTLKGKLQQETSAHNIALNKANLVQADLRAKVENLTKQLEVNIEETEVTRQIMEIKLESKYKEMSELDIKVINHLEDQLSISREEVRNLSEENDRLTKQNIIYQKNSINHTKFGKVLKEFAAAEACADALARALAESEREMSSAVLVNEQMEEVLCKVMAERELVKEHNKELSEKVVKLECELDNSHKYIESLRQKEQDTSYDKKYKEMERVKKDYEDKLLDMKLRILRTDRKAANTANYATKEAEELSLKMSTIENQSDNKRHNSEPAQYNLEENGTVNYTTEKIEIYSDSNISSKNSSESHPIPQVSTRVSVLRANGGRAGLAAKLKKTRESIQLSQKGHGKRGKTLPGRSPLSQLRQNCINTQAKMHSNIGASGEKENILC